MLCNTCRLMVWLSMGYWRVAWRVSGGCKICRGFVFQTLFMVLSTTHMFCIISFTIVCNLPSFLARETDWSWWAWRAGRAHGFPQRHFYIIYILYQFNRCCCCNMSVCISLIDTLTWCNRVCVFCILVVNRIWFLKQRFHFRFVVDISLV